MGATRPGDVSRIASPRDWPAARSFDSSEWNLRDPFSRRSDRPEYPHRPLGGRKEAEQPEQLRCIDCRHYKGEGPELARDGGGADADTQLVHILQAEDRPRFPGIHEFSPFREVRAVNHGEIGLDVGFADVTLGDDRHQFRAGFDNPVKRHASLI